MYVTSSFSIRTIVKKTLASSQLVYPMDGLKTLSELQIQTVSEIVLQRSITVKLVLLVGLQFS